MVFLPWHQLVSCGHSMMSNNTACVVHRTSQTQRYNEAVWVSGHSSPAPSEAPLPWEWSTVSCLKLWASDQTTWAWRLELCESSLPHLQSRGIRRRINSVVCHERKWGKVYKRQDQEQSSQCMFIIVPPGSRALWSLFLYAVFELAPSHRLQWSS